MIPTSFRRLQAALSSILSIALATAAIGQEPPAPPEDAAFGERIEVELVNVDVWVTDSDGRPVTGLGPDSFAVLHDDRPVPITHFSEVRAGASGAPRAIERPREGAAAPPPAAAPPSHLIVYFDQSRLHPSRYPALVRSLEDFLASEDILSEQVLILRQDRLLSVEAPFGSSRKEIARALERLAKGTASGMDLETETRLALEAIRDGWEQSQDLVGSAAGGLSAIPSATGQPPGAGGDGAGGSPRAVVGGVGSGSGPDACGMFLNQIQPTIDSWVRSRSQRIARTLTNLSSAAGFLAGLPGVKALIYLSDGLEIQPGAELATYATSLCPGAGTDLMTRTLGAQMTSGFLDLTRHANTNRVTIYSLQASGLESTGTGDASFGRRERGGSARASGAFAASKRAGEREGLDLIATQTGGRAVFNRNDLGPELTKIGEEIQHYYSLAYEPPADGTGGDRREHRIEVTLDDDSLTARYRRGYLEKDASQRLTERTEGALNLGITSNPLEVRLGAGAVEDVGDGTYRLPLHVMVPVEHIAFLPHEGSYVAEITVQVLSRAIGGAALSVQGETFRVKGSPTATGFANLVLQLELEAGAHVTAVGVRDAASREASFVSTTLQIGPTG